MKPGTSKNSICKMHNCGRTTIALQLCPAHYDRQRNGLELDKPIRKREMHGRTNSTEYRTWYAMKDRCYNPKNARFSRYGARGITVCERWLTSFTKFLEDMGEKPSISLSIERLDPNGNYEPENCVWADQLTQSRNKVARPLQGVGKVGNRWRAKIMVDYKNIHLGYFSSPEDAIEARQVANAIYGFPITKIKKGELTLAQARGLEQ